ncbi:MAG: hypothetical protein HYS74_00155 [Parcubacteria group bacterium]|nr:hypothetical protein [Parcubacteria group bacterium]
MEKTQVSRTKRSAAKAKKEAPPEAENKKEDEELDISDLVVRGKKILSTRKYRQKKAE